MINVFQIADNDQSIYYLGQIFGNVGFALSGTGPALLATMFKSFNSMLLAIGALIVTYTTIVGVLHTAQHGEFLGKKWDSLWVPLRMVFGIAALFPTSSGYCAAQIAIMWLIVQGVGAADSVWKSTVNYFGMGGAIQTPVNPSDMTNQVPDKLKQVFGNLVCQAAAVKYHRNDPNAVAHSQLLPDGTGYQFGRPRDAGDGPDAKPESQCGSVIWGADVTDNNNPAANTNGMRAAQGDAFKTVIPTMEILANYYVTQIISDPGCWTPCDPPNPMNPGANACPYFNKYKSFNYTSAACTVNATSAPWSDNNAAWNAVLAYAGSNFMSDAGKLFAGYAYNYAVNNAMKNATNVSGTDITAGLNQSYQRAEANGWIFAGAYYYYIAVEGNQQQGDFTKFILNIAVTPPSIGVNTANPAQVNSGVNTASVSPDLYYAYGDKNNNPTIVQTFYCGPLDSSTNQCPSNPSGGLGVANAATQAMQTAQQIGGGISIGTGDGNGAGAGPMGNLSGTAYNTINTWASLIAPSNSQENPIVTMQRFGHNLLIAAEVMFWVSFAVVIGLGFGQTVVMALGFTGNWFQGIASAILQYMMPVVFALIVYMISVGSVLGIYVPLLPYMLFTFGAIGWFIAAIEAMIAGPIIALGILSPGGQHEILGRAEPAVMLMLNVCLRPTLMIFGMFSGMLLSYVVIRFINAAFYNVVASLTSSMGLIEAFLFIIFYVGLVVTSLNKCFSLIYLVPDRVLRWIGGHHETYGEGQMAEEVKGKLGAGAEAASGTARGVGALGSERGRELGAKPKPGEDRPKLEKKEGEE